MNMDQSMPYDKSARGRVVFASSPETYTNANGETKQSKSVAIADDKKAVKVVSYDPTQFNKLVEGKTIMLRNFIRRDGYIILTRTSRLFPTQEIEVPDSRVQEGKALVNPPAAPVVSLREALRSPPKTKTTVCGKVIQDEEERDIRVGKSKSPTKMRTIYIQDETVDRVKVALWRNTNKNVRTGDFVKITYLTIHTYQTKYTTETSFNSTYTTSVTKVEQPTVHVTLTVIGACVQDDVTELLLSDDSVRAIPSQLLMAALPKELEEDLDPESFFAERKTNLRLQLKGSEVLSVKLQ
ncbi:uncharacterized protein LOC127858194 [Dreissena polymorpha]|uniref:uncharacterized protein LOC127858194 n=1 Tax=Dreissena polymorpha TaxID=45954 RepID=UPI00226566A4|nr:uncharacterized protein LOC127858194 [Dreissena polymorpha]